MARKGVLVSDPTVQAMSRAQWVFEYYALLNKERTTMTDVFKSLKMLIINVFGLNIASKSAKDTTLTDEQRFEAGLNDFVRLVMLAGNHHLLKHHLKDTVDETDRTGESKVSDEEYEAQAQAVMADMEPIDIPMAKLSAQEIKNIVDRKALNIKELDGPPLPMKPNSVIISD